MDGPRYNMVVFSLLHAWRGTARSGTLPLLFDSSELPVGSLSALMMTHLAPRSEIAALCQ